MCGQCGSWNHEDKAHYEPKYHGEPGRVFVSINGEEFGPFNSIKEAQAEWAEYVALCTFETK